MCFIQNDHLGINRVAALAHLGLYQTGEARKAFFEMIRINPNYEADVL